MARARPACARLFARIHDVVEISKLAGKFMMIGRAARRRRGALDRDLGLTPVRIRTSRALAVDDEDQATARRDGTSIPTCRHETFDTGAGPSSVDQTHGVDATEGHQKLSIRQQGQRIGIYALTQITCLHLLREAHGRLLEQAIARCIDDGQFLGIVL
ncbi:hypothetical protein [Asticcacaulis benevestitus]|uniref:hypothetical protein n=1 Tax=Asticcacaulis benevestitus TaxID=347481 RepID=UPI0012DD1C98|nr:hypothetical protein [Asticcacaulis benevestitus]